MRPAHLGVLGAIVMVAAGSPVVAATGDCSDAEKALEYWRPVREAVVAGEDQPVNQLAVELVPCLGSPDSELRDRIGYELLTYWLRSGNLTDETRRALLTSLSERIAAPPGPPPDAAALSRSFSALILSELMRSDAEKEFMSEGERSELLENGLGALARETDYRGLEEDVGWVHPVAHESDLLWRFALHPKTTGEQATAILDGLTGKVAPVEVFYGFNEGDRMARVAATLIERDLVGSSEIVSWLASFEAPRSMAAWSEAFASRERMAELHNAKQFLRALDSQLGNLELGPGVEKQLETSLQVFADLV